MQKYAHRRHPVKIFGQKVKLIGLTPNCAALKINLSFKNTSVFGQQFAIAVTLRYPHRLLDAQGPTHASNSTIPTLCIKSTKGWALPSIIGTSGPSISTMTLSTRIPASAASKCSTVPTTCPWLLPILVDRVTSHTQPNRAGMDASSRSVISVRIKTCRCLLLPAQGAWSIPRQNATNAPTRDSSAQRRLLRVKLLNTRVPAKATAGKRSCI